MYTDPSGKCVDERVPLIGEPGCRVEAGVLQGQLDWAGTGEYAWDVFRGIGLPGAMLADAVTGGDATQRILNEGGVGTALGATFSGIALAGASGTSTAMSLYTRGQTFLATHRAFATGAAIASLASNFADDAALVYTALTGDASARAAAYAAYQLGAADGYLPFADIAAAGKIFGSTLGGRTGCSSLLTKEAILDDLATGTPQAQRIAEAIRRGRISFNVLSEEMYLKAYSYYYRKQYGTNPRYIAADAFAWRNRIFMPRDSEDIFRDVVHEGTHALDYLDGNLSRNTTRQSEKRAWFQEHLFQLWKGRPTKFSTVDELLRFVENNYK